MADGTWSAAEAKAKFSEVIERARTDGPQHITRHGKAAVVMVSAAEWAKRASRPAKSFVEALLAPAARVLADDELEQLFARDPEVGRSIEL